MEIIKYPERSEWNELIMRPGLGVEALADTVRPIMEHVYWEEDEAVKYYEERFDHVVLDELFVSDAEKEEAYAQVPDDLKEAIRAARKNIETFHTSQRFEGKKIQTAAGVECWQKAVPIEKVGLYVPGGTAPLFSTVLMLGIPARIAGCREIIMCTPPGKDGRVHPAILFAAREAGVDKVFKIGGVQAIAAMAYGTKSVPQVHKIFGPGNRYVTAAKRLVSLQDVAIDMPAGPSEVAIIADETANPEFIAADFLSQAEHGPDSESLLVTTSESLIQSVSEAIERQLAVLPRAEIAEEALRRSMIILLHDQKEVMDFVNEYAPEHLIIQTADYMSLAEQVENAGSVFLGPYTPESAGDYASGTNHTLPTSGFAKAYSGVNVDSFIKKITFQEITAGGIRELGETIRTMAEYECLEAHRNAVTVRLNAL